MAKTIKICMQKDKLLNVYFCDGFIKTKEKELILIFKIEATL